MKTIFIDIETVSSVASFDKLSEPMQALRTKKSTYLCKQNERTPQEAFDQKAGIFAEFGKIVCIVIGFEKDSSLQPEWVTKTFAGHDEHEILEQFAHTIRDWDSYYRFCGHNILEFDLPYLCRRMLVQGIALPQILQLQNKKPWEIPHKDTMAMRKFGDRKNFVSLDLLAAVFGIPSPKDDIDGSDVSRVYHEEQDIQRIAKYCEKDVYVTSQVYKKLQTNPHG